MKDASILIYHRAIVHVTETSSKTGVNNFSKMDKYFCQEYKFFASFASNNFVQILPAYCQNTCIPNNAGI